MTRIVSSRSTRPAKAPSKRPTRPRKKAIQARSIDTVDAILRATTRILVREGYDALSTNRVATAAGVSIGSLYQYFPNKESLVAALLDRHLDQMLGLIATETPTLLGLPVDAAVRRFVELMIDAHRIDPELHRVFVEQIPRFGDLARIESVQERGVALARAYLGAHAAELRIADPDLAAFLLVTTVEAVTHGAVISKPELLRSTALVDETTDLLVRYLRA